MTHTTVSCTGCGNFRNDLEIRCRKCGGPFIVKVEGEYHERIADNFPYISNFILEPERKTRLSGIDDFLWIKEEFCNPTLSYKDRGMNLLFSFLKSRNVLHENMKVSEDSSGNAGASFSFFSKILKLDATVFVSRMANFNKISQIKKYGAEVVQIDGSRKDVEKAAINSGMMYLGHQYWPEFTDGFRSISYEIFQKMDKLPDMIFIPFSTGTLYTGIYHGFKHLFDNNLINKIPELVAVMPEIAAGIHNYIQGIQNNPQSSIADALTGMVPLRAEYIKNVIQRYGRTILIPEEEIIKSRFQMLDLGLDVEYSSAICYSAQKKIGNGKNLLILTGHGIKNVN